MPDAVGAVRLDLRKHDVGWELCRRVADHEPGDIVQLVVDRASDPELFLPWLPVGVRYQVIADDSATLRAWLNALAVS